MSVIQFYKENPKGIEKFLKINQCNINELDETGKYTALHSACKRGDYETIKILLKYNADVNAKNEYGATPLHFFVDYNLRYDENRLDLNLRYDIIDTLLKHNADIHSLDLRGASPVALACEWNFFWILKTFFKLETDIESIDNNSETARVITNESKETALVNNELNIDDLVRWKGLLGKTLLHIAAEEECLDTFENLLEYGADINSVCNDNKTVLHYIKEKKDIGFDWSYLDMYIYDTYIIYNVLRIHVIKLKCAKLKISKTNVDLIYNDPEFKQKMAQFEARCYHGRSYKSVDTSTIESQCIEEIKKLRSKTCGYVSMYNVLTDDIHDMSKLTLNEDFIQIICSENFIKEFPVYNNIIWRRWNRGRARHMLLASAEKYSLDTIFCGLTPNILHEIFRYLSLQDLKVFISAFGNFDKLMQNDLSQLRHK